jgi:hypothetical protein
MNSITKLLAVAAATSVVLFSCKKGDNEKLEENNTPVTDYMSTKQGSWWLYGSNDGTVTRRVATGRDSLKEGKMYNYYENTDTATQYFKAEYFGKNGDKFLTLADLDGTGTYYMTVVVHKDNAVLGDTWENTGSITYQGMSFSLLAEGEVTGVNQTMTINGHTYTDVVEVNNKLKAKPSISPAYTNCGTAKAWFKKGVGIIKADYDIHILTFVNKQYTDSLLDYYFVP